MFKPISILFILLLVVSCTKKDKLEVDVSGVDVNVEVHRFGRQFYTAGAEQLPKLKNEFPYLFPGAGNDSIWLQKIQDKDEQEALGKPKRSLRILPMRNSN